ncbi:MAG: hypothetical protein ACTHLE_06095 [Agriterribacter sp.]
MQSVKNFFETYAFLSMKGNARELAVLYAEKITAASPAGIIAFDNNQYFLQWLEQVFSFNQKTGMHQLEVRQERSEVIGEHFCNAVITWSTSFARQPGKKILFDIYYTLRLAGSSYQIMWYLSPQDEEAVMKEQGIL